MVSLTQLVLAIVASAVAVFIASSLIHMVFKWHNRDVRGFANEDAVRAAIRASNPEPGQYAVPYCSDMKDMAKPEVQQRYVDGPIGFMMLQRSGMPKLGPMLAKWFVLSLIVAAAAGYLASRTVPAGASFLAVARVVSMATFMAYATGSVSYSIWFGKPWSSTMKDLLDAFIYGLVTACVFGWLWPR
jgi:cobalamin synthase